MLRAVQKGWFSYDLEVFDRAGTPVARVDLAHWHENAKIEVGGSRYLARHEAWAREFVLEAEDGRTVAVAEKPNAWEQRFSLEYGGGRYRLAKESVWRSVFLLTREGVGVVGSVRRKSLFGRETVVDLPGELPLEVRVFILWLTVLMQKRDAAAASSTSTAGS
jgi:hypothetical protein